MPLLGEIALARGFSYCYGLTVLYASEGGCAHGLNVPSIAVLFEQPEAFATA